LGDPQPLSVYARISTQYGAYDVDDTGVIVIEWENHATSYVESGWWQPHADGSEAATQLYGEHGFGQTFPTLLRLPDASGVGVHGMHPAVEVIDPGFPFPRPEHCPQEMYDRQMAYFLECIRQDRQPSPGGPEGLVNMRIVDAAYESARTGEVVRWR
jgi:predicted dehydrogenase